MTDTGATTEFLLRRAKAGDAAALGELFAHYRDRLRKMVRIRLDRRMAGRLDASDVLQEAYLDVARRFPEYAAAPAVSFYLWLRALTGQRLIDLHRQHLGAKMRDAGLVRASGVRSIGLPALVGARARFDPFDLLAVDSQDDAALSAGQRQIKPVGIGFKAVVLTSVANAVIEEKRVGLLAQLTIYGAGSCCSLRSTLWQHRVHSAGSRNGQEKIVETGAEIG